MAEPSPTSKPTIIIVHGAWHRPVHFQHLSEALTSHGYKVVTPALPSVDKAPEHITPDSQPDIEAVRGAILAELDGADDNPNDVILVPHSYGGIPASGAVRGLDPQSRASAGKLTSVRAIAAITSFILPEGMDIPAARGESEDHAPAAAAAAAAKRERPDLVHPPPAALFWQDVPAGSETYAVAESNLNVMSMAALLDRCRFSAFEVVPVHFLLARDDQAMKFATQESMVQRIRDRGRDVRAEVLDGSSHSPFLSRVHETAAFVRRSAGEDV